MKKFILTFGVAALIAFGFSSCKKCTTCSYQFQGNIYEDEFCGSKSDREAFEATWKQSASNVGATATCNPL